MAEEETISWFAGVDWGSERHQVCLLDARGATVGEREFPHSGEGLAELGDWLLSMASAASTVAVAIEVPHGPVVDTLIDRGFVVYAINPKQLDRLRDRFSVAGAKDDRRDAYVQADGLRTDRRLFRHLQVADPRLIELRAPALGAGLRGRVRNGSQADRRPYRRRYSVPSNDLEPQLTRNGYDIRSLVEQFDAKPAEIRQLLRGELDAGRTRELMDEMRAAGLPT